MSANPRTQRKSSRPHLVHYVARFSCASLEALQRAVALHGAIQLGHPTRISATNDASAYELTLLSNYAVLERLEEELGGHAQYIVQRHTGRHIWLPVERSRHLNGHMLDQACRCLKQVQPATAAPR